MRVEFVGALFREVFGYPPLLLLVDNYAVVAELQFPRLITRRSLIYING